jgi:hypothetical protein
MKARLTIAVAASLFILGVAQSAEIKLLAAAALKDPDLDDVDCDAGTIRIGGNARD